MWGLLAWALLVLMACTQCHSAPSAQKKHKPSAENTSHPHYQSKHQHLQRQRSEDYPKLAERLTEVLRTFFTIQSSHEHSPDVGNEYSNKKGIGGNKVEILPLHPTTVNNQSKTPLALILTSHKGGPRKYFYNKKNKHGHVKANVEISNDDSDEKHSGSSAYDDDVHNAEEERNTITNEEILKSLEQIFYSVTQPQNESENLIGDADDESNYDPDSDQESSSQSSYNSFAGDDDDKGSTATEASFDISNEKPFYQGTEVKLDSIEPQEINQEQSISDLIDADDNLSASVDSSFIDELEERDIDNSESQYFQNEIFKDRDDNIPHANEVFNGKDYVIYDDNLTDYPKEVYANIVGGAVDSVKELLQDTNESNDVTIKYPDGFNMNQITNDDNHFVDVYPSVQVKHEKNIKKNDAVNINLTEKDVPSLKKLESKDTCPTELKKLVDFFHNTRKSYHLSFLFHR